MKVYYFGCESKQHIGHFFYQPGMRSARDAMGEVPWGYGVERLPPGSELRGRDRDEIQVEGSASLQFKDGWTAIAWWDRSGDSRFGSKSVFVFDEILAWVPALKLAEELFPEVFARYTFPIILKTMEMRP